MSAKKKPVAAKRSRFEISIPELEARLAGVELPKAARDVLMYALGRAHEDDVALWVDVPFAKLDREEHRRLADPARTAAQVFTKPFVTKEALRLNNAYLGGSAQRDDKIFVFLDEVSVNDLCCVPDTVAIFAKGLVVKRLASFDSPDGHAEVAGHLKAPYVVANVQGGGLYIARGTEVEIGAYARHIQGLPKGTKAKKHSSLRAMLPFLAEEDEENVDTWELMMGLVETGKPFPTVKQAEAAAKAKAKLPSVRGKTFVFAGKIAHRYATTEDAKRSATEGGGIVTKKVSAKVDYLVIGDVKSALLGKGPKTTAQLEAEKLNASGASIAIVREGVFWDLKK